MSMNQTTDAKQLGASFAKSMIRHWRLFLVEGIVLVILGLIAIVIPPLATFAVTVVLGWIFFVSGIMGLITTSWASHAPGYWWSLISALLGTGAGLVLLAWPLNGVVTLTLVLIIVFAIEGIASIMYALEHRQQLSGRWDWMLFSGFLDLVLAAMIFVGLPGTAAWAVGLLVGINMIFGGSALVAMALHARVRSPSTDWRGFTTRIGSSNNANGLDGRIESA